MASRKTGTVQQQQSKSKLNQSTAMKWNKGLERPPREAPKGLKPVAEPATVSQMALLLLMHVCRKITLFDVDLKIGVYGVCLLVGSAFGDFMPLPKTYLSHKGNFLNQYFAKLSWGWTLTLVGTFVYLTSKVYCCNDRERIKWHLARLAIGTACWYSCTAAFGWIEAATGLCFGDNEIKDLSWENCLKKGYRWRGFDISGHSFLLIYCSLVIHEEAKAIKGWERIKDLVREVDYDDESPLKVLSPADLANLRTFYEMYVPYVKLSFIAITLLCLLWDFLLLGTILYYHTMAQKVAGGLIAVLVWFATYRILFANDQTPFVLPGRGPFKYAETKPPAAAENRRRSIIAQPRPPLRPIAVAFSASRNGQPHGPSELTGKEAAVASASGANT